MVPVDPEFVPVIVTVPVPPAKVANPGVRVDITITVVSLDVKVVELVASIFPSFASNWMPDCGKPAETLKTVPEGDVMVKVC